MLDERTVTIGQLCRNATLEISLATSNSLFETQKVQGIGDRFLPLYEESTYLIDRDNAVCFIGLRRSNADLEGS